MSMNKVLLVGIGDIGKQVLNFLVRDPKCPELLVGDFNEEFGKKRVNAAISNATVTGLYPKVTFTKMDLTDIDRTAEQIAKFKPDVVINGTVMQTWHVIRALPTELYQQLSKATLGAWTPGQVALGYKLMQAIKKSGVKARVVNTAFSCETNPMLASVDLAPDIGIGNVELLQPGCRMIAAEKLGLPISMVQVYLVAHHLWWVYRREFGYQEGPYWMKIMVNDKDVTNQFDTKKLLSDSDELYNPGPDFTVFSAASTIKNMYALMDPVGIFTHSPGPGGLPGGYPVFISQDGAKPYLPEGITLEEAIAINERSQYLDGIAKIEKGGTVHYSDFTAKILKDMLGFDKPTWKVQESYEVAKELIGKYREYASKHGVKFD